MLIVMAREMGMCFGVKDALEMARQHPEPARVTIHGELVHNPQVNDDLYARGYRVSGERARTIPETPEVMITAHGISHAERQRLTEAGKQLVDTTCPLVRRVHKTALLLHKQGYLIVVVGKPGHVEVQGLVGDLQRFVVWAGVGEVKRVEAERLAVLAQTTTQPGVYEAVLEEVRRLHPDREVRRVDTICGPTRERQAAAQELLGRVDAVVVVGGKTSNNTRALAGLAAQHGVPCQHVETADELDLDWARGYRIVGLTAGTSTPDEVIAAVHRRLLQEAWRGAQARAGRKIRVDVPEPQARPA